MFAAASLTDAISEIASRFQRASGHRVRFSFAASSLLARQIEAGAPAQIFASANVQWMDYLQARGRIESDTRIDPIENTLVLITTAGDADAGPDSRSPAPMRSLPTSGQMLQRLGTHGRLAMADPAHVPAGIYAQQALRALGIWPQIEHRLAFTDNVRGALALVERGEAPLGVVYASDAMMAPRARVLAEFPATTHERIRYPFAIVKDRSSAPVRAFMEYLSNLDMLAVWRQHGFRPLATEVFDAR